MAQDAYTAALAYAAERGAQDGTNAAGWYAQDALRDGPGHPRTGIRARILAGIADGDPAVLDTFPYADLSGEWADTLTGPQLFEDAIAAAGDDTLRAGMDIFGAVCDTYETAFSDAVAAEIERTARYMLAD